MTKIRKKWLFGFSILFGLILLGFAGFLLTRKPAALSLNSHPTPTSNEGSGTAAYTADTGESPNELSTQSSADARAPRDFSGVTTIDPTSSSTVPTPQMAPAENKESPLPLVFQPVDPRSMEITPEQQEVLDWLQQNFLDQISDANQDPNDPQYRQRWEEARPLIDEQLKLQLGQDFFIRYEMATVKKP